MGRIVHVWGPAFLGLALGVLALWPALGPGFVLRYDMVFVPDPPILPDTGGFPRAMPSDLVVALLSGVLPDQLVQKGILLGIFVLAASGAAALVPGERLLPRLAAAAFYAWNIYLAQRLLLGQWALLLGFAGLPWVVHAAGRRWWHLALALLPAAAGGFQAMLVTVLTLAGVAPRRLWLPAVLALPWLVPALAADAATDPAGVDAFAARADGPFGTLGSLLSLGGVWNAEAGVPGQDGWWPASARLLLALVGLAGFVRLRGKVTWWRGLALAASAGLVIACAGAFAPGLVKALIAGWPGFGPLRDGQAYLAPLVLAAAVGFGTLVPHWLGVLAPLLVLPTFALGAFGRLAAVDYPADWLAVQRIVNADPAPGAVLSLPWGAHRAFAWNGGRVVLDPATKLFERRVIWDDGLSVRLPDGRRLRVRGEDLGERPPIRYVLIAGDENRFLAQYPGWGVAYRGQEVVLLRVPGGTRG
ncbi:hypothetical protein ACIBG7_02520 [Nonomuraea sp. NPDC050328]|uniref:hypothetical protein n=1 Tax=Nonomuraea sp. NPDC050328 TaxID=3364361 RepID=UPI00378F0754